MTAAEKVCVHCGIARDSNLECSVCLNYVCSHCGHKICKASRGQWSHIYMIALNTDEESH